MDYRLPRELYMQTVWFIKSYDDKLAEYNTVAYASGSGNGGGRSNMPGDPTSSRGMRALKLAQDLKAVEDALQRLPEYYRGPVLENVVHKTPWPPLATTRTFKRYKRRFVYYVAYNLGWL